MNPLLQGKVSKPHRTRALWLCGTLHGFTHVYQVALLPLYFAIRDDLRLESIELATLLVTVLMLSYFLPSYLMGILADRFSRKKLLTWGLVINAMGFIGLSLAPNYATALVCVVISGFGGSFFHPSATAMVARLFPRETGRALGLIGVGASIGFFAGPLYAGWRATTSGWRAPVFELGLFGLLAAAIFAWLAEEQDDGEKAAPRKRETIFHSSSIWMLFIFASFAFSLRDFAGSCMGTLGSLFLQQAHGVDMKRTGFTLSAIFLASAISNPVFGRLSDRNRITWTAFVLTISACLVAIFPRIPAQWAAPFLMLYGFFFLSNYPMVEAALMDSVHDSVRGRVFGFFITIGGFIGNLAHWVAGDWVKRLGQAAGTPASYYNIYLVLAALMLASLAGLPLLMAVRRREREGFAAAVVDPLKA